MRPIPDPGFASDDGAVDPAVVRALAAYDKAPDAAYLAALAVLQDHRVLVPVTAVLGEVEARADGPVQGKSSDMATVLVTGQDGRRALLAFTGAEPLAAWDPAARPVPILLRDAARAAVHDGAAAMVLDLAGPVLMAIETEELCALADGYRLVQVGDAATWAWARTPSPPPP